MLKAISKLKNLTLSQKGFLLVLVPLAFEIIFVATLYGMLEAAQTKTRQSEHARLAIASIDNLFKHIYDSGAALVAYKLTHSTMLRNRHDELKVEISDDFNDLKDLTRGHADEEALLARIEPLVGHVQDLLKEFRSSMDDADAAFPLRRPKLTRKALELAMRDLNEEVRHFNDLEKSAQGSAPDVENHFQFAVKLALICGVIVNVVIALGLVVFFNKGTRKRLNLLMDNTVRLAKGKDLNPILSGSDEIAHLDRTFHDMADALKEVDRLKKEILEMVSHDLRSPLTAIQSFITLLGTGHLGQLNPKGNELLEAADVSSVRMLRLINDLLDIEKLDDGKLQLDKAEVPLAELFDQSVQSLSALARDAEVTLVAAPTDLIVLVDGHRIVQVVVNLVSNALKFSPASTTVTVSAVIFSDQSAGAGDGPKTNGVVEIRIADQGRGIPQDKIDSIFNRFEQVQQSDSKVKGGSGLGLAICKALVELHDGQIGVESQEGKGSTFYFRIPTPIKHSQVVSETIAETDKIDGWT
jgi:signal transduction histidine kinase